MSEPSTQSLADYRKTGGKPQLICWEVHEGMRGSTTTMMFADGRVAENTYRSGDDMNGETVELGSMPSARFEAMIELLLDIPERYLAGDSVLDPQALITVDCIFDDRRWKWAFPPWEISEDETLSRLHRAVVTLKEQLPENGVEGQADQV